VIGRLLPNQGGRPLRFGLSAGVPFNGGLNPSGLDTGGLVVQVHWLSLPLKALGFRQLQ
jgi:hypothetical protein